MIPEIDLNEFLSKHHRNHKVDIYPLPYEDGALPDHDACALINIAVDEDPRIVLEIGTFFGATTLRLAIALPYATIHTVDLPPNPLTEFEKTDLHLIARRDVGRDYLRDSARTRIHQHFGDTATWDFKKAYGATFFFIDGSHSYAYVKNDTEKCYELCRGNGCFIWHDADERHPGVTEFLGEWSFYHHVRKIKGTNLAYYRGFGF